MLRIPRVAHVIFPKHTVVYKKDPGIVRLKSIYEPRNVLRKGIKKAKDGKD